MKWPRIGCSFFFCSFWDRKDDHMFFLPVFFMKSSSLCLLFSSLMAVSVRENVIVVVVVVSSCCTPVGIICREKNPGITAPSFVLCSARVAITCAVRISHVHTQTGGHTHALFGLTRSCTTTHWQQASKLPDFSDCSAERS